MDSNSLCAQGHSSEELTRAASVLAMNTMASTPIRTTALNFISSWSLFSVLSPEMVYLSLIGEVVVVCVLLFFFYSKLCS